MGRDKQPKLGIFPGNVEPSPLPYPPGRYIIPLINFTSEINNDFLIGNNFCLKKFPDNEKNYIQHPDNFFLGKTLWEMISPISFEESEFILEYSWNANSGKPNIKFIMDEIGKIITTFRLFKKGNLGVSVILGSTSLLARVPEDYKTERFNDKYNLCNSELTNFLELYQILGTYNVLRELELTLSRFNKCYGRINNEDKIIDLTVAIESCLLKDNQELSYKFCLRGTSVLSELEKYKDTQEIFNRLKKLYNIRSKIVHEGKLLEDLKENDDYPNDVENLVRDLIIVLKDRIVNGLPLIKIKEGFDVEILNKLTKKT